jgi:hypothetical protein
MGEMRAIPVAVASILVAGALSLSGASDAAPRDTLPGLTPARRAELRDLVIRAAASMGEQNPTNAVVLASTQCKFYEQLHGDEMMGCAFPVFVVAYQGDFIAYGAPVPYGVKPPSGRFAFDVLREDTFKATDFGLMPKPVDISGYGPSIPLDLSGASRANGW